MSKGLVCDERKEVYILGSDIPEDEWLDKFADKLATLMYSRGYSQASLSNATSISRSTISKYLNAEQMPTAKSIVNLSYALNCEANELIDFGHMIY